MAVSLKDVQVTGIVDDTIMDEMHGPQPAKRIFYVIEDKGPFSVLIPNLQVSAQSVLQAIQQDAQKLIDILNISFEQ